VITSLRTSRIIHIAILVLLICTYQFAVAGKKHKKHEPPLPVWFWDTPQINNGLLTVGYSKSYIESKHAYQDAFLDGAWRLFCGKQSRIAGEKAIASSPSGMSHMGSTIREIADSTGFSRFCKRIVRIDSAATPTLRVILIGTRKIDVDQTLMTSPPEPNINLSRSVSQGCSKMYEFEYSSWLEAERKARNSLATGISIEQECLEASTQDNAFKTIVTKTDILLTNVQTIHRRFNRKNGVVSVWINGQGYANLSK